MHTPNRDRPHSSAPSPNPMLRPRLLTLHTGEPDLTASSLWHSRLCDSLQPTTNLTVLTRVRMPFIRQVIFGVR